MDDRSHRRKLKLHRTAIGDYWLPDVTGDHIAEAMKAGRIFEREIVEEAKRHITKGSTVLDVGSSFGQMTLIFSRLAGPDGRVYSFEADDYSFTILRKNIEQNGCANVTPVCRAVWNRTGEEVAFPVPDFREFPTYGSYGLDPGATEGRKVETISIDSLDIRTPISFMKVDVQGSDLHAMQGARETIARHRMPILFEFERRFQKRFGTTWGDYRKFIRSISFRIDKVVKRVNYLIVPKGSGRRKGSR